jgi:hypothetical protein
MEIKIDEKEFGKAIVNRASEFLFDSKNSWRNLEYPIKEYVEKVLAETPEINNIIKDKVKELLNDPQFMKDAMYNVIIDNFGKHER